MWASAKSGSPPRPQVLVGLGGVGKTQLAVEYAHQWSADYIAVLWVKAETPESLRANLAALAEPLELPERTAPDQSVRVEAVRSWLGQRERWLLLLDNADTPAAQQAVLQELPKRAFGHILITSRISDWPTPSLCHRLDVLSEPEAVEFLLQRSREAGMSELPDAALQVARRLAGLPLALEQAAAYVLQRRIGFAEYLKRLETAKAKLMAHPARGSTPLDDEHAAVATTWTVTEAELGAGARALLRLVSFFAPEEIPRGVFALAGDILLQAVQALGEELPSNAADDAAEFVEASLVELDKFSLITLRPETFSCHRLVMEVQRLRVDSEETELWIRLALQVFDAAPPGRPDDVRNWSAWDALRPHVAATVEAADRANIADPTARWMSELGLLYKTKALWTEAEPLMRRALGIDEKSYGTDHPEVAIDLSNLAQLLQDTNGLAEAEPLMRRSLSIDEKSYGADHPEVAIDLSNLAQLLQATNRLVEAEPLMRRALSIDEKSYGADHPRVAIDLNNLAQLLQDTNRLAEAEPLMRRALSIADKSYGADHPTVAIHLNNLAHLLQATNRREEAEVLMRRALSIADKSYGADHPEVAIPLSNLAHLLHDTNRFAEAEPLMRRALSIGEKSYGADHPTVATHLNNLAHLLQATNRPEEGEPLLRRALLIFETSLGPEHPRTLNVRNNLNSQS